MAGAAVRQDRRAEPGLSRPHSRAAVAGRPAGRGN